MAYTTINKSTEHFNTKLYTGTGSSNAITGVGFQPDWNWIKCRSHADSSQIFDVLRTTYALRSDGTNAEAVGNGWTSLDSDGFTLNGDSSGGNVNNSGRTYASWNWKANGSGSANTDGSINSTVSVNTTAGFSIVKYTGTGSNATVGHGLGVAPKMIIEKQTDSGSNDWGVYHASQGAGKYTKMNTTEAFSSHTGVWQGVEPTNTVFSLGNSSLANASGGTHIAYCFAEKKGYSKFGSYTGNGNADGTFVYTGFKPAFVLTKQTNTTGNWILKDNKRPSYQNPNDTNIYPNTSAAEETPNANHIDFLSNGFKIRNTGSYQNTSGGSYIYMAFAEEPLVANVGASIPATAR